MNKKTILLLNPPGDKIYLRDVFCSKVSKGNFINQPFDFVILSGILAQNYNVIILDAIAEKLSFDKCFDKILNINFDFLIFLTGFVSWQTDFEFIKKIKKAREILVIGIGDILLSNFIQNSVLNNFIDAILLDITGDNIIKFLEGQREDINGIVFKEDEKIVRNDNKEFFKSLNIPLPRHNLFLNERYNFPLARRHPFASVLCAYGCPFKCDFCVIGTLGFKYRDIDAIIEELKFVISLGMREIYFGDQTFFVYKPLYRGICEKIILEKLNLSWFCYSRVDVVNREELELMKEGGCHTIIFGVESGNDEILKRYNKGFTTEQVRDTFKLCRQIGIRTVATFIIGLPGEDVRSCLNTIEFSKKIGCDYASFNIPVPRPPTKMYEEALQNKWLESEIQTMDQSGSSTTIETDKLSSKKIYHLRNKAEREFYLRPFYILRRLFSIRTGYKLKMHSKEVFDIILRLIKEER